MFDISFGYAFFVGLLSFLSPCILPMVPFYLAYMAGVSINELNDDAPLPPGTQRRAILTAVFFAAGVTTTFMGMGATATVFGQLVREWFDVLKYAAAAIIGLMGLHFLGVIRIGILNRQVGGASAAQADWTLFGAYVIGLAFAFGWTSCAGPALAAILSIASAEASAMKGALLLATFGIGMTLPFVLAAIFVGPFLRWSKGFRKHLGAVEKVMGALLIIFALLIATDSINHIAQFLLRIAPDIGVLK
ncbi:cytochrome c biogenesis CcdA family protein [Halovulum sp. GXIMD14793]